MFQQNKHGKPAALGPPRKPNTGAGFYGSLKFEAFPPLVLKGHLAISAPTVWGKARDGSETCLPRECVSAA
jgi:hypothetical protein